MVIKQQVHITPFGLDRTLHIYLPKAYENDGGWRYPVMYMYDGHNLFFDEDATYGKSWGLAHYLDRIEAPLIIAGLECNHEGNMRLSEFSPYDFRDFSGNLIHGMGKELMRWMTTELKDYVDTNFRTIPDRDHTGIGGSSMGGLMAFYSVVRHNDVYSKAACLSSSFEFCMNDVRNEVLAANALNPDTRVYMSFGSDEVRNKRTLSKCLCDMLELSHLLNERMISTYPWLQKRGRHCEADWERQNDIYMHYLWD